MRGGTDYFSGIKNVLITGGAGFIGSNLAVKLISKGYFITVLDNLSPQVHGKNPEKDSPLYRSIKNKVKFIKGNVTSSRDVISVLKEQDAVIHLAAETGTGQSMYEIKKYTDVNIGGTANILDVVANKSNSIKKIIVASSRAIYGEGKYRCPEHDVVFPSERKNKDMLNGDFNCKCPICGKKVKLLSTCENSKPNPVSLYGITKLNQEQMVMMIGKSLGIPSVALRYQNVYGPGQSLSNPYTGILSIFSTRIKNGNNINVFEDGNESRDFVYIDDAVDATILGLEKPEADFEIFNVGAGKPIDVVTVADTLIREYNSNVEVEITGNYRIGDIRHNYADLNKIHSAIGFHPKVDFKNGIKKFVQWVNLQDINIDNYQNSLEEMSRKGLFQ